MNDSISLQSSNSTIFEIISSLNEPMSKRSAINSYKALLKAVEVMSRNVIPRRSIEDRVLSSFLFSNFFFYCINYAPQRHVQRSHELLIPRENIV